MDVPAASVRDNGDFVGLMTVPTGMTLEEVNGFNAQFRLLSEQQRATAIRNLVDRLRTAQFPIVVIPETKTEPYNPPPQ